MVKKFKYTIGIIIASITILCIWEAFSIGKSMVLVYKQRTGFEGVIVSSLSMGPTFSLDDRLLVNKLSYSNLEPQRGDIILFLLPNNISPGQRLVKRIIGIPGDSIEIKSGELYINDQIYNGQLRINNQIIIEPYILEPMEYVNGPIKIPTDVYFVLGDNRNNNDDRHMWFDNDFIPKSNIVGKVQCIYWPILHQKNL